MEKIKNKNNLIIALSLILVVVLVFVSIIYKDSSDKGNSKNNSNKKNNPVEKVDVNNLTEDKTIDGLKIDNIVIEGIDEITISADINNVTTKDYPATLLNFVLLDGDGKVLKKLPTQISKIKAGEKETITVDVTGYYGDSRDFRLEKR